MKKSKFDIDNYKILKFKCTKEINEFACAEYERMFQK